MASSFFLGCLAHKHRIGSIEDCFQHRAWGRPVTGLEAPLEWVPGDSRWKSPPSRQLIHVLFENTKLSFAFSHSVASSCFQLLFQMCSGEPFRLRHHIGPTLACPGPIDGEGEGRALLSSRSEGSSTASAPTARPGGNTPCRERGLPGNTCW